MFCWILKFFSISDIKTSDADVESSLSPGLLLSSTAILLLKTNRSRNATILISSLILLDLDSYWWLWLCASVFVVVHTPTFPSNIIYVHRKSVHRKRMRRLWSDNQIRKAQKTHTQTFNKFRKYFFWWLTLMQWNNIYWKRQEISFSATSTDINEDGVLPVATLPFRKVNINWYTKIEINNNSLEICQSY